VWRQPDAAARAELPESDLLPRPRAGRQWIVEDEVTVAVDGSPVWDVDEDRQLPAVVVRMPAHVARHLASLLDDWTTIGHILESCRGADERGLAGVLHEAATVADELRRQPRSVQPD